MGKKKHFKKQEKSKQIVPVQRSDHAIVLDFLPYGYPFNQNLKDEKTPIIQALAIEHLALLELVPKEGAEVKQGDIVYIGNGKREKIHHINGRLSPDKLTSTAKAEMEFVVPSIVKRDSKRFVDVFNNAQPLSMRMHSLELIPGMSKERMLEILEERKGKPFDSFDDFKERVKLMPDPEKAVIKRIIRELGGNEKDYLFVGRTVDTHTKSSSEIKDIFPLKNITELAEGDIYNPKDKEGDFSSLSPVGILGSHGYSTLIKSDGERYGALRDAIKKEGVTKVISSLKFNKNMKEGAGHTRAVEIYEEDIAWVNAHYGSKYVQNSGIGK